MRSQVVQGLGESSTTIRFARGQELARGGTMSEQAGGKQRSKALVRQTGLKQKEQDLPNPEQETPCHLSEQELD